MKTDRLRARLRSALGASWRALGAATSATGRHLLKIVNPLLTVAGLTVLVWAASDFGSTATKVAIGAGLIFWGFPWEALALVMFGRRPRGGD